MNARLWCSGLSFVTLLLVACGGDPSSESGLESEQEDAGGAKPDGGGGGQGTGGGDGGGHRDSAPAPLPASDAGMRAFGEACTEDRECTTGTCASFNAKGKRCTKPCSSNADCPNPPNLGCNNASPRLCKVP
jgi:hypothetical protein